MPWPGALAGIEGRRIYLPTGAPPDVATWLLAHELGHHCLRRAGAEDSEWGADYIGRALLLPGPALHETISESGYRIRPLKQAFPRVPLEVLLRRMADRCGLVVTVLIPPRVRLRALPASATDALYLTTEWELRLAQEAYLRRHPVCDDGACASPIDLDGAQGVAIVATLAALLSHLPDPLNWSSVWPLGGGGR